MALTFLSSFGIALVVGAPREARRRFGVPVGGPFDAESFALANALCGNLVGEPCLELSGWSGRFVASEPTFLALIGAEAVVRVSGSQAPTQSAFQIGAGEEVEIEFPSRGVRAYLATPGGFQMREGRILASDELSIGASVRKPRRLARPPGSLSGDPIRIVPGPQFEMAPKWKTLHVSAKSDRIGVRLEGSDGAGQEIPSQPACVGAIQLTPSGELIIIGPDGPTIGGYPIVACVASCDLSRVGQLRARDEVQFEIIDLDAAGQLGADYATGFEKTLRQLAFAL